MSRQVSVTKTSLDDKGEHVTVEKLAEVWCLIVDEIVAA